MIAYSHALTTCYECIRCNDPFNASEAKIVRCNTICSVMNYFVLVLTSIERFLFQFVYFFVQKMVENTGKVTRTCTANCLPFVGAVNSLYCCNNKDNCNSFHVIKANKLMIIIVSGLMAILRYKFWQNYKKNSNFIENIILDIL